MKHTSNVDSPGEDIIEGEDTAIVFAGIVCHTEYTVIRGLK